MWGDLGSNKNMELLRVVPVYSAKPLGLMEREILYFRVEIPVKFGHELKPTAIHGRTESMADRSSEEDNGLVRYA